MLSPEVFRNNRVLASNGEFEALLECQPIMLRGNGGTVCIHLVKQNGHDAMFLRAVTGDGLTLTVFDLRKVDRRMQDILHTNALDVPGLVNGYLRQSFATRAELLAAMLDASMGELPIDAEAAHSPEVLAA